jgi:hypothetical protein
MFIGDLVLFSWRFYGYYSGPSFLGAGVFAVGGFGLEITIVHGHTFLPSCFTFHLKGHSLLFSSLFLVSTDGQSLVYKYCTLDYM